MPTTRPDFDEYFLGIAEAVSLRGDCRRRQAGAVIVDDLHRVVSTGYNGVEPGEPGCLSGACPRGLLSPAECPPGSPYTNCISTHAEANAIAYAKQYGEWATYGTTIYTNFAPCLGCQAKMYEARIMRAVWPDGELFP